MLRWPRRVLANAVSPPFKLPDAQHGIQYSGLLRARSMPAERWLGLGMPWLSTSTMPPDVPDAPRATRNSSFKSGSAA
jgi:hypothetical protein